ncbi:MAG: hypothetical protein MJ183_11000, partial [Treponemataceae bacterium]|nr:hypothetical protein [Treponemataceae bacterium]
IQTAETLSKLAARHIREIGDKLKAVRQAVKNPETAAKGDVKVGKNAQKIYDQTLREQLEWEHWYTNPELSNLLKKEAGIEETPASPVVKENLTTEKESAQKTEKVEQSGVKEEIPDVGDSISKTTGRTQARINALHNLKDGKYHAFGLTFEKATAERSVYDAENPNRKTNETVFIVDGNRFNILEFEEKISKAEGQESFKKQYNPNKEPREITSSTYDRAQKRLEQQASGVVTGKNVPAGPDITNKESGKENARNPQKIEQQPAESVQKTQKSSEKIKSKSEKNQKNLQEGSQKASDSKKYSIKNVWTGSSADYDQPSVQYIGSGEGQQVFGWGLYGTERRGIAEHYAQELADNKAKENAFVVFDGKKIYWTELDYKKQFAERDNALFYVFEKEGVEAAIRYTAMLSHYNHYSKAHQWLLKNKNKIRYEVPKMKRHLYRQTFWPGKQENLLVWNAPVPEEQKNQILNALSQM